MTIMRSQGSAARLRATATSSSFSLLWKGEWWNAARSADLGKGKMERKQ